MCRIEFQDVSYDAVIKLKYDKFQSLLSFKYCSKKLFMCVSEHIKQKLIRIDTDSDKKKHIEITTLQTKGTSQ